jgi:hypothetical protein
LKTKLTQSAHDGCFSTAELIRMERLTTRQVAMRRASDRFRVVRLAISDNEMVLG